MIPKVRIALDPCDCGFETDPLICLFDINPIRCDFDIKLVDLFDSTLILEVSEFESILLIVSL